MVRFNKALIIVALLLAISTQAFARRVNRTITVTAGTPVQISTTPLIANRIFIQMKAGGTGVGYVMDGIPVGTTPAASTSGHLTAQLAAATSTAPGGSYSDGGPGTSSPQNGGIDLQRFWIDVSVTCDVIVSYDARE